MCISGVCKCYWMLVNEFVYSIYKQKNLLNWIEIFLECIEVDLKKMHCVYIIWPLLDIHLKRLSTPRLRHRLALRGLIGYGTFRIFVENSNFLFVVLINSIRSKNVSSDSNNRKHQKFLKIFNSNQQVIKDCSVNFVADCRC